ncbi:AMP-binding protein [Haloechinothrix salitolerans]|uniref:AMP-binding protein n=1 Tax=Haloechinothrix salitolerans TaxID=926830 RepID=A0ABW2C887_9PSEU
MAADANVADLAASAAANWPDVTAFVESSSELRLSWRHVDKAVNAIAATLRESGVAPGDRVVVRLPTSAAYAVAVFGVLRAGGIAVPSSPQSPVAELRGLLAHSGANVVITAAGDVEWPGKSGTVLPPPDLDVSGDSVDPVEPVTSGEDIAMLCYTTSAKGSPRGVMLSHRALLANVEQVGRLRPAPVAHGDRVLVAIPLFHVYGFGLGLLQVAARGATAVLAERFDAATALADCRRHEITIVAGVPTMFREFAEHPSAELSSGLASVRLLTSGAAPLHPKVLAAIEEATGLGVYEGYGLTETAPVLTSTIVTGYPKPGSVGRAIPGVELRLIGNDGAEVGAPVPLDENDPDDLLEEDDVTGLVTVRGDNLFSGYWPDGQGGPDEDGWFQTNDVGYLDTDGDLHLVDRVNDLIIVNGFNVYPHEVEDVIAELPGVAEVAAVGVVDERSGEAVKAVVVVAPSAALSEQQVIDHCTKQLARYKVPSFVEFADDLPHTALGKLSRTPLR